MPRQLGNIPTMGDQKTLLPSMQGSYGMLCVLAKGGVTLFPYDPDTCCTGIFVPLTVGSLSVGQGQI
jgi:hypothetical protein